MRTYAGYDLLQRAPELHSEVVNIETQAVNYGIAAARVALEKLAVEEGMNPDPLTVWPDDEPEDSGAVIVYLAVAFAIVVVIAVIFLVAGR